jgi:hypothetical protein
MMCKNESAVIRETLRSVKPYIDCYSIMDTGSTDDTKAIIHDEMKGIPGTVWNREWKGWDKSRTECIELAKRQGADFLFILDADEKVLGGTLPNLQTDCSYWVTIKYGDTGMIYSRLNILSTKHNWHYVGVTHEYLTPEPDAPVAVQTDIIILTRVKDKTEAIKEDIRLLTEDFAKDPTNSRTIFYLAQSYKDAGEPEKAINLYKLRSQMGGWDEEVYISLLRVAQLKCHRRPFPEVANAFIEAHQFRPSRAGETLGCFADFCQWWADGTAMPTDRLFLEAHRYRRPTPVQQPQTPVKPLIAIMSCEKDRWLHETQRQTWIADIPEGTDYKFFLGAVTVPDQQDDEVVLSCGDDYASLTEKMKAICKWALEHGYTHVFKCDTDTCVWVSRLLQTEYWKYDYVGGLNNWYASGGSGYWLSRRAMQWVVEDIGTCEWEDVYVGQVLKNHGITLHADNRFQWEPNRAAADNNTVSLHLSHNWIKDAEPYQPRMMFEAYQSMTPP